MTANFWFADRMDEDEADYDPAFPWRIYLQLAGMVGHLSYLFQTKEDAEDFIREDVLGAGVESDRG